MGYYSEVAIVMYKENLKALIEEAQSKQNHDVIDLIKGAELYGNNGDDENGVATLRWDYVKWYDSFPNVRFIMDFIQGADRQYRFVRIGEEDGDIEIQENDERGRLYEYASPCSYIELEGNTEYIEDFIKEINFVDSENSESNISDEDFANILNNN